MQKIKDNWLGAVIGAFLFVNTIFIMPMRGDLSELRADLSSLRTLVAQHNAGGHPHVVASVSSLENRLETNTKEVQDLGRDVAVLKARIENWAAQYYIGEEQ